jgi:hypothetical protein
MLLAGAEHGVELTHPAHLGLAGDPQRVSTLPLTPTGAQTLPNHAEIEINQSITTSQF